MKASCALVCLALAHGITASIIKQQERGVEGLDVQQLDFIDHRQLLRDQTTEDQKLRDQTLQGQKLKDQALQNQKLRDQTYQDQKIRGKQLKNQKQQSQVVQEETNQLPVQQRQEQLTQVTRDQQQLPTYAEYQRAVPLNSQEWPVTHQHSRHSRHHDKNHRHSSSESSQESMEKRYYGNQQIVIPGNNQQNWVSPLDKDATKQQIITSGDNQKWISPLVKDVTKQQIITSGDNQKWISPLVKDVTKQQIITSGDNQKWISPLVQDVIKNNLKPQVEGDVIEWNGLKMTVGPDSPVETPEDIEQIFGEAQKTMRPVEETEKLKLNEVIEGTTKENNEDAHLNATQLAQKYGYPIEEHIVKTDDGYVLTVFRILPKKQVVEGVKTPVVFLMHGLLGSADDWMLMGPGKSLAYLLSDAGYDVWLGNARGNKYSRHHVNRWPAMSDFWQFSIDQIALHDLPAMIDFALETTKQEKLNYIGHALGNTAFFALTAVRPEYNTKIVMMHALSPMVYMTHVPSPLIRMIAPTSKFHERILRQIGNEGFFPSRELIHTIGGDFCQKETGNWMVCSNVNFVMSGVNVDGIDAATIPVILGHLPAGTSAKVIEQYGQGVASDEFRRFDYGPYINMQAYGNPMAPKYNLTEVVAPVNLYYSNEDWLADPIDVMRLQKELPNVKETYMVPEEHFTHMDFQFSTKAPEMVYQRILESLKNVQTTQLLMETV